MRWASAISEQPEPRAAAREVAERIRAGLGGERADLAVVFCSPRERDDYRRIAGALRAELGEAALVGCSARSVIGAGREYEERAGLSLTAASLPGVRVRTFHLGAGTSPADEADWRARLALGPGETPELILLPDPFSCDAETLLVGLDRAFPAGTRLGGLASAGATPGENALFAGDGLHFAGLAGAVLVGNVSVDAIVAQGCRPVGQPMFVTRAQQNLMVELDGRPPLAVLQELFEQADEADRQLFRSSLFLGIEMRAAEDGEYRQGDFLIRNLIGSDAESGALAVAALLRDGLVVQFHLRDARTSAADLEERLERWRKESDPEAARGALLFSCLGRGQYLYGRADHDTDAFRRIVGDLPLGGFFCNGEIGPVERQTFLHGYTSAFGIFRERRP
jgi:small ligand-binding sensory domain FIST